MIHINPAMILVIPAVKVVGGKRTQSKTLKENANGAHVSVTKQTVIEFDNREERKKAEDFAQRARNMARSLATYTPLGYLVDANARPQLEEKVRNVKQEADKLNQSLTTCRVEVGVALLDMSVAVTPAVAQLITDHIRDELQTLKTAIGGGADDSRTIFNRVRNIGTLATGVQADAIKYALEEAKTAIKGGKPTNDLPQLDNAITLFTPGDPLALPEAL